MKNFPEKFFHDAYFREAILARDFCLFLRGSLFWVNFLGKKICDELFSLYGQKNPGTGGGGGSGPGMGEYLGDTLGYKRKSPRSLW